MSDEDKKKLEIVIIGGSLRITLLHEELENYLNELNGKKLTRTLNMDESVCLGNSYYGLIQLNGWNYTINNYKEYNIEDNKDIDIAKSIEIEKELSHIDDDYINLSMNKNKLEEKMYIIYFFRYTLQRSYSDKIDKDKDILLQEYFKKMKTSKDLNEITDMIKVY